MKDFVGCVTVSVDGLDDFLQRRLRHFDAHDVEDGVHGRRRNASRFLVIEAVENLAQHCS